MSRFPAAFARRVAASPARHFHPVPGIRLGLGLTFGLFAGLTATGASAGCAAAPVERGLQPAILEQPPQAAPPAELAALRPEPPSDVRAAIDALERGDYRDAYAQVAALCRAEDLASARQAIENGSPEDALIAIDHALQIDPHDREAQRLKAAASFALGEKSLAAGGNGSLITGSFEDALHYYQSASDDAQALLGASRAAYALGRWDKALDLAQEAVARLDAGGVEVPRDDGPLPERVLAEASFRAYVEEKQTDPEGERARNLFGTAEDAFGRLLGRDQEPWVWHNLVDLYLWQSDFDAAVAQAQKGLDRDPHDGELLDRLAQAAHGRGGPADMAATFTAFNQRHPGAARGEWYEAQGRFDEATDQVMALFGSDVVVPPDDALVPGLLREAEDLFARCRNTDESYAEGCRAYEALTHSALGWYLVGRDRLAEAPAAFLAAESVHPEGLTLAIEGRLLSAIDGLKLVGERHRDANRLAEAGHVFALLHERQPKDVNWANNQGFFLRDAAVELEALGRSLCAAAGAPTRDRELLSELRRQTGLDFVDAEAADEHALMVHAADAAMERAREWMRSSFDGYAAALELAPEDVRIVNDTALILVYYLHERLDYAEGLLKLAIALGEEQSKDETLDEDARFELLNAWGDAFQNLGVLYANLFDRPQEAVAMFERSVEIGPEPRPLLTNYWLPRLAGEEIEGEDPTAPKTWAEACAE